MSVISTPNFEEMDIEKLRVYAEHLKIVPAKTANKAQIIKQITDKLNGRVVPEIAEHDTGVPPGYAKIQIHEDPMPGASNLPVYLNCNGYQCTIPRGRPVIVPMRVVRTLNDAQVQRRKQTTVSDTGGRERFAESTVTVPSYPFQVLEMTPGPEPLTALEAAKLKTSKPRLRYAQMFGYFPRPGQLQRAIEQGLISLNEDEELPESELMANSKKD